MDDETRKLQEKCERFRALIIGRPNAGKTTILKCIAQSADGRVDPSSGRGEHDINEELVFESNPRFVFHDSRGIESGSTNEMETIQNFISECANARSLAEKLHAIWYCIPTDNTRLVTAAELQFFDKIDPNGVPVLLRFTKFESVEAIAFDKLEQEFSFDEALVKAPQQAREDFDQDHLDRFKNRKYPPDAIVYLKNMHEKGANCSEIVEVTTSALNSETLKKLLVTVQQTNMELCAKYALSSKHTWKVLTEYIEEHEDRSGACWNLVMEIWCWYYHLAFNFDYGDDLPGGPLLDHHPINAPPINDFYKPLLPLAQQLDQPLDALYLCASLAVVAEHSFWLTGLQFPDNVQQASEKYAKSLVATSLSSAVQEAFGNKLPIISNLAHSRDEFQYEREIGSPLYQIVLGNLLS